MKCEVISGKWRDVNYHFACYKNDNFKKQRHLISVSLFFLSEITEIYAKLKCTPLEKMKKDYEKKKQYYLNGLNEICSNLTDSNLVIFCDKGGEGSKIAHQYLKNEKVEVVEYDFPQISDNYGFFGTLMRFIPLFDFDYFDNEWSSVCVLDLDNSYLRCLSMINYFKNSGKTNLAFWTRPCYYMAPRMYAIPVQPNNYSIICSFLIQREPQDSKVLIDFLNDSVLADNEEYRKSRFKYLGEEGNNLEYGIDEYFINSRFLQLCYYNKQKPFEVIMHRDVFGGVLEWLKYMRFCYPLVELEDEEVVKLFMKKCAEIFFPANLQMQMQMKSGREMMEWVGETFYGKNLHMTERRVDQKDKLSKLAYYLADKKFKKLNLVDGIVGGLKKNSTIPFNSHSVFLVAPKEKYPLHSAQIVGSFKR